MVYEYLRVPPKVGLCLSAPLRSLYLFLLYLLILVHRMNSLLGTNLCAVVLKVVHNRHGPISEKVGGPGYADDRGQESESIVLSNECIA